MTATRRPGPGAGDGSADNSGAAIIGGILTGKLWDVTAIDRDRLGALWLELVDGLAPYVGDRPRCMAEFQAWKSRRPDGGEEIAKLILKHVPSVAFLEPYKPRFRYLTLQELMSRRPPTFLIDDILVSGTLAALTAEQESYKSFQTVAIALSIALGIPWHGHAVRRGDVVYVNGEGGAGLRARVKAWCIAHQVSDVPGFYVVDDAVQLLQAEHIDGFVADLHALGIRPSLVVIDPLARSFAGGDENSARDMGTAIAACDRVKRETGATVLLVHHLARAGNIRGSTALPAGLDTHISAKRDGDLVTLTCEKQKDFEHFGPIRLARTIVELGDGTTSLVFIETTREIAARLSESNRKVFDLLQETFGAAGAPASRWVKVCVEAGIPERSAWRAITELEKSGKVAKDGDRRGAVYRVV